MPHDLPGPALLDGTGTGNPRYLVFDTDFGPHVIDNIDQLIRDVETEKCPVYVITTDRQIFPVTLECTDDPDWEGLHFQTILNGYGGDIIEHIEYLEDDPSNFDAAHRTINIEGF